MIKKAIVCTLGIAIMIGFCLTIITPNINSQSKSKKQNNLVEHKFNLAPIGKRSQIRAIVKPGDLTESDFKQTAVALCKSHIAYGSYLVRFFSNDSCLNRWDGTGCLQDSDWPYWLAEVIVDTASNGKLYVRVFKLARNVNTGKYRTDVIKR
jgi:hypothetical protein